jgi:hypothetical protein
MHSFPVFLIAQIRNAAGERDVLRVRRRGWRRVKEFVDDLTA